MRGPYRIFGVDYDPDLPARDGDQVSVVFMNERDFPRKLRRRMAVREGEIGVRRRRSWRRT